MLNKNNKKEQSMSKKSKIITALIVATLLVMVGVFNYLYSTGRIKLKAQQQTQAWTDQAYLTDFLAAVDAPGGQSGKNIQAHRGDTVRFQVTVAANQRITNPVIYACTNGSYGDSNFEYIDVDPNSLQYHYDPNNYSSYCHSGACGWIAMYDPNFSMPAVNGSSFTGPAMKFYLNGDQAGFSGVMRFEFRGTVKSNAPNNMQIKRGWSLGWYDWGTNTWLARDWSTGDASRAIVTVVQEPPACPDGYCNGSETCSTCPADCGACPPPTCTSFTYSEWGPCVNGTQTRTITGQSPAGCTGGTPEPLSRSCTNPTPNITGTKSAYNEIQKQDATKTVAHPGDVITYHFNIKNDGDADSNFVVTDDITNILKYASVSNISSGGKVEGSKITYASYNVTANGGTYTPSFQATIKPVDQLPKPKDDSLQMTNTYQVNPSSTAYSIKVQIGYSSIAADSKFAFNETQKIPATDKNANPGDVIRYTLEAANTGNSDGSYVIEEDISDILQYADVQDEAGGGFKIADNKISWTVSVPAGGKAAANFAVKVKPADQWPSLGDLTMSNTYGPTTVDIKLQPQSVPQAVIAPISAVAGAALAPTGTAILLIILVALLIVLIYWIVKKIIVGRRKR